MSNRPPVKRAVVFVDGQNLFHAARHAFGYTYPNFDVTALAKQVCAGQGWKLVQVRFYTGIPDAGDNPRWHSFWTHKLAAMGRQGVVVYSRPLRYRNRTVPLPDGTQHSVLTGEEKGISASTRGTIVGNSEGGPARVSRSPEHRRARQLAREMGVSTDQAIVELLEESQVRNGMYDALRDRLRDIVSRELTLCRAQDRDRIQDLCFLRGTIPTTDCG